MLKINTVVGARPQFIKAAALSRAIQLENEASSQQVIEENIIHTGQHYDAKMSDIFFEQMKIPKPKINLGINGSTHGQMTGDMIAQLEKCFIEQKPDIVLVYGDTNSTLAAAIAASKLGIEIAHVEAGLRSFNPSMPEEINRILTDAVSTYLFCPTQNAVNNLNNEGLPHTKTNNKIKCRVEFTGDIMFDAVKYFSNFEINRKITETLIHADRKNIFCTIHRQENVDNPEKFKAIIEALNALSSDFNIIFPIHPRTKKKIEQLNLKLNFEVTEPIGYLELLGVVKTCDLVVTDSGGLQKESCFLGIPCAILREETEWVELLETNAAKLISPFEIAAKIHEYLKQMEKMNNFFETSKFGNGNASKEILKNFSI
jgi:UDP-GlcNAc3NAcA epimerase